MDSTREKKVEEAVEKIWGSSRQVALHIWDVIVVLSVLPSIFLVTFQAFYSSDILWQSPIIYITDAVYLANIVGTFFRSFTRRGVKITNDREIAINYISSSFFLDLASVLPLELFSFAASNVAYASSMLRLNRCIRCYKPWTFLSSKEKEPGTNTLVLMNLRFAYLLSVCAHILGGVWFSLACHNKQSDSALRTRVICEPDTWSTLASERHGIDWNSATELEKYIVTLYWSVTTITSVGYGDLTGVTPLEKWIAIASMIVGVVLFGYILGGLASMLTNADAQRSRFIHCLNAIQDYLKEAKISHSLQKKVTGYYEYLWQRNKGKGGSDLFDELPLAFRAELSLETYKTMLEKSTLFKDAPEELLRMLSLIVKHSIYLPQQVILNKGDIGHHMYFVHSGEVEVLTEGNSSPVAVLREGDIFGEKNLVHTVPTGALVRAKTHCDMLKLAKEDVQQVLQHFPDIRDQMEAEIKDRCDTTDSSANELTDFLHPLKEKEGPERDHKPRKHKKKKKQSCCTCCGCCGCCGWLNGLWVSHPVMPGAKFTIIWDIFVCLVTVLIAWIYSYQAAFTRFKPSVGYSGGAGGGHTALGLTYLLDLVLVADIIVSTKRAIQTPTEVITDQWTAFLSYIKSLGCYLDIASVLPLEVFALAWLLTGDQWSYLALFRLNRLLKLWKVVRFFSQIEHSLYISISKTTVVKFTVYVLTVTHLSACLWYIIACFYEDSCADGSWAVAHSVSPTSTPLHDYLVSLYWACATMTTVGYGDVRAYNVREMVLSLVVQMVGVLLYGYCLGAVAATLTNVASPRVSFQEKIQVVHQFMSDNNLGKGLLRRVDHYFTLLWEQYRGESVPGEEGLMRDMPRCVREDVSMEECSILLDSIPVFKRADPSFLRQVSLAMSAYVFAPRDIVLYSGDIGREIYCIEKGYLEILSEDLSQVVTVLGPGNNVGELGFLFGAPRVVTVRAATHCKLMMLSRRDVDPILPHFPLIQRQFNDLATDKEYLRSYQEAVLEASTRVTTGNYRVFTKPCTRTALAVAMTAPLSAVIRSSIASTIAACVGDKDTQYMLCAPVSFGEEFKDRTVIKYDRKDYEGHTHADEESTPPPSVRHRTRSRVAVSPDSRAFRPSTTSAKQSDKQKKSRPPGGLQRCVSSFENIFAHFLLPYTVIPNSLFGRVWEVVSVVLALVSVLTVSLQAAFLHSEPVLWTLNYLLDIFFIANILLKLHTAYYDNEGVLITQPIMCALHYFRTSFFLDIISSFPSDLIVLLVFSKNIHNSLRTLSLSRLNRLLRIYKLPMAFKYLESQVSKSTGLFTELKFAVYMAVCTHWTACGWFLVACSSLFIGASQSHLCTAGSWAHMETLTNYSIPYKYVISLYWATATTTTVGYGDISAHTDLERVYAIFIMIVGVVAYGYIIASVAASLANADSGRAQYQEKLNAVKSYMKDQGLDPSLTKRVINYYEYIWQRNKGVSFNTLFHCLPLSLQADISLSLYKESIDQVPLFQNTEIGFTKLLALSFKPILFMKGEYVVRKGDIGSEMYFIKRGTVDVVSEDGSVVFASMKEGKFFGEISLVFSCPRTASIRARTNCDLFMLTKGDLDNALQHYPHIARQIQEVANCRATLVKKRSQIARRAAAEGKSASDAAKAAAEGTVDDDNEEEESEEAGPSTTTHEITVKFQPRVTCLDWFENKIKSLLKLLLTFTLPGDGMFGTVFHITGCLLSYVSFFTICYQAAFQNNAPVLWAVNYIFEAYFLLEMFLKFHLSYEDTHSHTVVSDIKSTALHYLKNPAGFPLDLVAILPYELIGVFVPNRSTRTVVVLYLRLPHAVRVIRTHWFFSAEEKKLNQRTLLLRLLKFIALITVCTHFVACVWYVLGCPAGVCQFSTWAETTFMGRFVSDADRYCISLYWAVATMTTVGYGDFSATNVLEMIYSIVVMVVGKLLFGFILGSIASTLANLDSQRVLFEEKLSALKDYMKEWHLSSGVRRRVLEFFDYLWARTKGTNQQTLLADMPYCMRAEVSLATTELLLKNVPILADADNAFLRHLILVIKPCMFLPGEYIVRQGDVGLGLFLLHHGRVEVMDEEDSDQVKQVLTEGSSFGERSLLYNTPMESSVRAATHVDMLTFGQADFENVLSDHPNMLAVINELAETIYGQSCN